MLVLSAVTSGRDSMRELSAIELRMKSGQRCKMTFLSSKGKTWDCRARREVQIRKQKNVLVFRTLFQKGSAVQVRAGSCVMCIGRELSNNCVGIS